MTTLRFPYQIDPISRGIVVTPHEVHKIHTSTHFIASFNATIGIGLSTNVLLVPASTKKYPHLKYHASSDSQVTVTIYEGADYSGGTPLTAFNNDRNSSVSAGVVLTTDATDDGGGMGTALTQYLVGSVQTGGTVITEEELILNPSYKYLIVTEGGNGDNVSIVVTWYEHWNF